nr:small acid-soluble spore protein O [Bacillus subtilis]
MVKRKANHVINGMNDAKSQGKGAGYIENDQLVLTEAERQNNKKKKNKSITPNSFKEVLIL